MTSPIRALVTGVGVIAVVAVSSAAWCQERADFEKTGAYVGVAAVPDFTLDGVTFDGSNYYRKEGGDEILILPRLSKETSIRGIAGYRASRGAFEAGYEQTQHDGTFLGLSGRRRFTRSISTNGSTC